MEQTEVSDLARRRGFSPDFPQNKYDAFNFFASESEAVAHGTRDMKVMPTFIKGLTDQRLEERIVLAELAFDPEFHEDTNNEMVIYRAALRIEYKRRKAQVAESASKFREPRKIGGYIYLLQSSTGAYKIGRTKNPDNRLATFGVLLPFEVEYACLIATEDMHSLERSLHGMFASQRINGEWFALSPADVDYIKGLAL